MKCPVCEEVRCLDFASVEARRYWRCETCQATFMDPTMLPSPAAEIAEYQLHRNDPNDAGYREFLSQLAVPLLTRLSASSRGLDYGCGPGPALPVMLREAGHEVALYDPFFHREPNLLDTQYDFITCTEVIEHFHRPAEEFAKLEAMLRPGGMLGLMTRFQTDDTRFASWHYRRDPTHVVFYREATLRRVAERFGWSCEIPQANVAIMTKPH
jgi:SAM-dependent methyltransferase